MDFENFPPELQSTILSKLTPLEASKVTRVSRNFFQMIKKNIENEINQTLKLSVDERAKKIFKKRIDALGKDKIMQLMINNYAVIAFVMGLLDCQKITPNIKISTNLLTLNGLEALKARILPDQFIYLDCDRNNMEIEYCLMIIIRNLTNAIIAFKEKLLTPKASREFLEKALLMRCKYKNISEKYVLDLLLSNIGIYALRKGILTQQKAAKLYYDWKSHSYATYPVTFCNMMATPVPIITVSLGLITLEEFAGYEHEADEIKMREKCIALLSKETQRLVPQWYCYKLDSQEAYAYIRKLFVDYAEDNIKAKLLMTVSKFFNNQEHKPYFSVIKNMLLKPEYLVFNKEVLIKFFAELKSLIDYTKIDKNGELQAIIITSMCLSDLKVAFDLIKPLSDMSQQNKLALVAC